MQADQAPCNATGRVEFPLSVTSCLGDQRDESLPLLGGIFSGSKLSWLSKGPLLEIVHTLDGAKVAAWTFGAVVRDFKTKVTCVAELPHSILPGCPAPVDQVAVGLECELTGGMICVFNLAGSRVLRAINIPSKVTAISVVALGDENIEPLHQCLKPMSGIAAVGTSDGSILLVDLRRSDCNEALRSAHSTHWEGVRDELQSCGLISLKDIDSNTLEDYPDDHLFLHLNEKYFLKHERLIVPAASRDGKALLPEDPSVTSLLYVPQLGSLIAGFACGAFQVWSLQSLSLVYSSPVFNGSPLVQFSFQEASDDPNAYCYLWAVRGGLGSHESVGNFDHPVPVYGPPSATMFSLCYDEKVWLPEYGYLYKNFMMCSTGFEFDLSGGSETVGGRLISLHSVSRGMSGSGTVHSPSEDSSALGPSSNAISLCLLVWETWGPTGPTSSVNPINTHMALFDINQWYVDQMPSRLSQRGGSSRKKSVASYLVSYDLGNAISSSGGVLLDVGINASTLIPFSSVQNAEEFSRPSSLSFASEVLMGRQIVHIKHPGVQRALLTNLVSSGPGTLMTPTNVFHECLALGLRPLLMDISSAMNVPLDEQRTFVMCVALEQRLGRFVCRCAREWADGRLSAAGCTLNWLLSVAWNRAAILKQLAIRICAQLFDHSGEKLDSNDQKQLHHIVGIFHLLETLFENVVQNKWHLALNEWPQVNLQNDALKLECQYYDVLQWLIDVDLLPEAQNSAVPYSAQEIAEFYHSRRLELQRLFQQQGEEEVQDLLLIDSLLRNEPGGANIFAEWERDAGGSAGPGGGLYPPISLQAMLRTFLIKDVSIHVKHSVVIYVLMDLANIFDNDEYKATLQKFGKFPAAFCVPPGALRLTQAFWHLDHKDFDTALDMLLDPLVSVRDILPWQHRCIIRLLTLQGQAHTALRYVRARRPPLQEQSDIRLHLNLLIANDLIDEAFMYQRSHRSEENAKSLLTQFFNGCEERNNLRTVLQFSLDDVEEVAFSRYLESSKHPSADDLRVLYLLKRSRYVEALDVNQELRKKGRSGGTRDIVVNGFYKTLPSVTRKLASHCAQQQHKIRSWSQVEKPSPLFVNPKISSPQMRYKSSLLEAAVEKSRETWNKLVDRIPPVFSGVESTPFLCTPRTKLATLSRSTVQNEIGNVRKRVREDDDVDNNELGNTKRSRFQRLETALVQLQQQNQNEQHKAMKERFSTYSCTDTLPMLHTPVVQRRSPSTRAKLQQEMIASSPAHSSLTPQSIIKVRQASGSSKSESPKRVLIRETLNEPELTEEDSESEPFPGARKPSKGESETDSEPGDKDEEGPVGVTARRIIDFDSDMSSELSVSQSDMSDLSASQGSIEPHSSPSVTATRPSILSSEKNLSRMVVLSEARKAGKPHTVTFGKGSICVYDQDEPVDAEVAVQDESSNDTVDQDPSRDETAGAVDDQQVIEQDDDESTQECNFESSVLVASNDSGSAKQMDSQFRSFRLDTSGIGTMNTSEIVVDLSATVDSEVFHSADSSAQGSMCSPTFRKSLARPPVREITRRISGIKRSQQDLADDDESRDGFLDEEVHKSARLEEGTQNTSSSHNILTREEEVEQNEEAFEIGASIRREEKPSISSVSSLARPPIRNVHISVGKEYELSSNASEVNDNSSCIELFSAQSTSHDSNYFNSQEEEMPVFDKEECEVVPTLDVEAGKMSMNTETMKLHNESQDSVEIVELDDNSDSSHNVEVQMEEEGEGTRDLETGEEAEIVAETEEEESGTVKSVDTIVGEERVATIEDEDSGDGIIISDNSNVFRTSHIDHGDSSSESETDSSKDKSDSDDESYDSDSQVSKEDEVLELNQFSGNSEEISADNSETRGSNEGSDLNQACVVDSDNVSSDACESGLYADANVKQTVVDLGASSSNVITSQLPEENQDHINSSATHVIEDVSPTEGTTVEVQLSNICPSTPPTKEMSPVKASEVDQDDMPRLRLDAASSSENLFESPEAVDDEDGIRWNTSAQPSIGSDLTRSESEAMESATQPPESSADTSPKRKPLEAVAPATPIQDNEPSTPKSSRRGMSRRPSISSIASEESSSLRRVTRSQQRSLIMEQSFESTSADVVMESESVRPSHESQELEMGVKRRTRKNSASSQDGQKESKPPRIRRSSTSSVGESKTSQENKPRRRHTSVSSQGSVAEQDLDEPSQSKLGKIEEEAVPDTASGHGIQDSRKQNERKRKASELSDVAPEASSEAAPNQAEIGSYETYETSRRLTRHQRALLAKSIEMNSMHAPLNTSSVETHGGKEEDRASDDDDKMSVSSVRSSQRLRMKQQRGVAYDSPSSTASTIINPALTPSTRRQRRQSNSDVSELNRDASPASSVRRQRSLQAPGTPSSVRSTPTRRSARLSALQGGSQESEDGDNQSIASLSPSSVTSGRKSATRKPGRRLSLSSEISEPYAFASPQVELSNLPGNTDADMTEAFVFSPPKTIATPSKARSSSVDSGGSASRKGARQSKSVLQTIKEESSTSRISVEDGENTFVKKSKSRQSWFFIDPPSEGEGEGEHTGKNQPPQSKQPPANKRGRHSVYSARKKFPVAPLPQDAESESESDPSTEESEPKVKVTRSTRQSATGRKQKK